MEVLLVGYVDLGLPYGVKRDPHRKFTGPAGRNGGRKFRKKFFFE